VVKSINTVENRTVVLCYEVTTKSLALVRVGGGDRCFATDPPRVVELGPHGGHYQPQGRPHTQLIRMEFCGIVFYRSVHLKPNYGAVCTMFYFKTLYQIVSLENRG
jgi:hypothetical protein